MQPRATAAVGGHGPEYLGAAVEQPPDPRIDLSRVVPQPPNPSPLGRIQPWSLPGGQGFLIGDFRSRFVPAMVRAMLRALLDEIVGRLRQFGSRADSMDQGEEPISPRGAAFSRR